MNDAPPPSPDEIVYLHAAMPRPGETTVIAPGLLWARLPLPFRLNHVNIWLLQESDGWTAIDTGVDTPESRAAWDSLAAGAMHGRPLRRLIATHGHTDHIGLAGWLADRFDCPFRATQVEWMSPQIRRLEAFEPMQPVVERFLESHGCDADTVDGFRGDRKWTRGLQVPMPPTYERIRDGDTLRFGERDWQVIVAGGHASEHASFYCAADNILIVGDQILSKISPMIGVFPHEPTANPLAEYLASLPRFAELPHDVLVLPSHGIPFRGLHARAHQLADHHRLRLAQLERLMDRPKTAMELTAGLFERAVAEGQGRLAMAETLAHIHLLLGEGRAYRVENHRRLRFAR